MGSSRNRSASNGRRPVPDALTGPQYARLVVDRLHDLQGKRAELTLVQLANDHGDAEPMTWMPPKLDGSGAVVLDDGQPVFPTYGERVAELTAAEERVWRAAEARGLGRLVESMLAADAARAEVDAATVLHEGAAA